MISEELREELRKIVREEVNSIIFEKQEFHTPIRNYIKGLFNEEIRAYKMFKSGFLPDEGVVYTRKPTKLGSISFSLPENVDLYEVYQELSLTKKIDCTFEIFESVLARKNEGGERINWTDLSLRNKDINQQSIFELLYVLDNRILTFDSYRRKRLIEFVCRSFLKDGAALNVDNMNNSFSKWRRSKK